MHQAPWTPSVDRCSLAKRDKINIEASQSYAGRKLTKLLGSNHIVALQCCINTGASRPFEHGRPHPSRTKKWGDVKEGPCKRDPVTTDGNGRKWEVVTP
jgi:hypothetical protein